MNVRAQDKLTIDSINATMDEMLKDNRWNKMITYGENALGKGYEFFFLRARLGIAYYETKKYFKAITNLERAFKIGYDNPTVLEDLYYSYLYTGRDADRYYVFSQLPENYKSSIKPLENSFVDNLHMDAGIGISNDYDKNNTADLDGNENFYGEQTLTGNEFYFNVGLNQIPFKYLNVNYDYFYLNTDKKKVIEFDNDTVSSKYSQLQSRFYNSYNIHVDDGFIITPAGNYVGRKYSTIYENFDSAVNVTPDSVAYFYTQSLKETSDNNFVISLDISKFYKIFKFGINGSFSYLNNLHQSQYGLSFKVYPAAKVNFYSNTDLVLQNQQGVANLIVDQSFGGWINNKFVYELSGTVGKMNNFNQSNGYKVYNTDIINYKLGFDLQYYFSRNFRMNFGYGFQSRERNYVTYTAPVITPASVSFNQKQTEVKYRVNNLLLGINYNF